MCSRNFMVTEFPCTEYYVRIKVWYTTCLSRTSGFICTAVTTRVLLKPLNHENIAEPTLQNNPHFLPYICN
jgi:hypothetical protein